MPITAVTFIIGWLAIAGVPPFAGFWSKDEILLVAWNKGGDRLRAVGRRPVTALLTAFYMSRQVFLTFFGEPRWQRRRPPRRRGRAVAPSAVDATRRRRRRRRTGEPRADGAARSTRTSRRGR